MSKKMPGFELFGGSRLAFFETEIRRIKGGVNPTYKCEMMGMGFVVCQVNTHSQSV